MKIISGGQTGADCGALEAALSLGRPCGGSCPDGRFNEDGEIPARFPLTEIPKGNYRSRTIRNIADSDGTLIIYFSDLDGGTEQTVWHCMQQRKPYKLIDASEVQVPRAVQLARLFVQQRAISVLNVAGPRASKCPHAHTYAFEVITGLLLSL